MPGGETDTIVRFAVWHESAFAPRPGRKTSDGALEISGLERHEWAFMPIATDAREAMP
jgi:hypothetical protein